MLEERVNFVRIDGLHVTNYVLCVFCPYLKVSLVTGHNKALVYCEVIKGFVLNDKFSSSPLFSFSLSEKKQIFAHCGEYFMRHLSTLLPNPKVTPLSKNHPHFFSLHFSGKKFFLKNQSLDERRRKLFPFDQSKSEGGENLLGLFPFLLSFPSTLEKSGRKRGWQKRRNPVQTKF